jgi:hypothetical protein
VAFKWYHLGCALGWLGSTDSALATLQLAHRAGGRYAAKAALQMGHLETRAAAAEGYYVEAQRDEEITAAARAPDLVEYLIAPVNIGERSSF